jgi:hypothetical protein
LGYWHWDPHLLLQAIFWVIESMIPFGNHPLFLILLGWMLPPKPAFMKLTTTPVIRAMTFTKQVFQDIVLPINRLEEQINKESNFFLTRQAALTGTFSPIFFQMRKILIVLFQLKYGILPIDAQKSLISAEILKITRLCGNLGKNSSVNFRKN